MADKPELVIDSVQSRELHAGGHAARGRPVGPIAQALAQAAQLRPGTVRDLAQRALVGYAAARYTASRMLARGELVPVQRLAPIGRGQPPTIYGAPPCPVNSPDAGAAGLPPASRAPLTKRRLAPAAPAVQADQNAIANEGAAELQRLLAGWLAHSRR